MTTRGTVWPLDDHTRGKHQVLRYYLAAWFPILGSFAGRVVFIDGFAGPGEYAGGEPGSPLIALEAFRQHASRLKGATFLFIEREPDRATHLKQLLAAQSLPENCRIQIATADFERSVTTLLDKMPPGQHLVPAFVMLDPFGVSGAPMSLIRRLLGGGKAEIYVSFMYEFIDRFKSTPEFERPLDELYGTPDWRKGLTLGGAEKRTFFFDLYATQLRLAGAKHVLRFDLYRHGHLVYALFFATKHAKGSDVMKQAMWKVAPFGDFSFHGGRDSQLILGLDTVDYTPLRRLLQGRFRGRDWLSIDDLMEFVASDQTDFHTGQVKKQVLVPMETSGLIEVDPRTRQRARTYPPGTRLRFR